MSLEEKLLKDFQSLSEDKKVQVIDFIDFLKSRSERNVESLMDQIIEENKETLKELSK